ncbi:hypothetical protein ACP70R_002305 [Stipagrostis hirtigluma subsp. patula]
MKSKSMFFCASSFDPPAMPDPGAAASHRRSGSPSWVLLDKVAYLANRRNGTTAGGYGRTGQAVEVSFWLADPPRLSHLCVHCPGLEKTDFAEEPFVVCSEKNIAVLQVYFTFGPKDSIEEMGLRDYFVYRAHHEHPSLELLPTPSPRALQPHEFGLLPCVGGKDDDFVIAVLRPTVVVPEEYDLYIFSSSTWTWSDRLAILDPQAPRMFGELGIHRAAKVIALPRDTLAFVDLRLGILLCRVHEGTLDLHHIGLPELMDMNTKKSPSLIRDVTFSDGVIKFIEIVERKRKVLIERKICPMCKSCTLVNPDLELDGMGGTIDSTADHYYANDGWDAITWSRSITSGPWVKDCEVCVDDIAINNPRHFDLLPDLRDKRSGKSTLNRNLITCYPTLSMLEQRVFHLTCKVKTEDKTAWILAINMRKKCLEDLASLPADRIHYLLQSALPSLCSLRIYERGPTLPSRFGCKSKRTDDAKNDPTDTTIILHGYYPFTTGDQLRNIFSAFGHLCAWHIPANKQNASVQFVSRSCAEEAMRMLNGTQCGRLNLVLSWGGNTPNKQPRQPMVNQSNGDAGSYR